MTEHIFCTFPTPGTWWLGSIGKIIFDPQLIITQERTDVCLEFVSVLFHLEYLTHFCQKVVRMFNLTPQYCFKSGVKFGLNNAYWLVLYFHR